MRLIYFLIPRLAIAALTMLGVSSLVFVSLRLIPGGFADVLLGPFATPEARAMIEVKFGLDESIPVQFFKWLIALLQGDFGTSMVTRTPVIDEFLRRGPVTAELALLTFTFAIGIGFPLGVWSGIAEGSGSPRASLGRIVGALGARTKSRRFCPLWGRFVGQPKNHDPTDSLAGRLRYRPDLAHYA